MYREHRPEFHRHNRQPSNGLLLNYSSKNMYNNPQYKRNQVYNLRYQVYHLRHQVCSPHNQTSPSHRQNNQHNKLASQARLLLPSPGPVCSLVVLREGRPMRYPWISPQPGYRHFRLRTHQDQKTKTLLCRLPRLSRTRNWVIFCAPTS